MLWISWVFGVSLAAEPARDAAGNALPPRFQGELPGTLAFQADPQSEGRETPTLPEGALAFDLVEGDAGIAPGTSLFAVSATGSAPVRVLGARTILHGCDGGFQREMLVLYGPPGAGLRWVLPEGVPARGIPLQRREGARPDLVAYDAGDFTITLDRVHPERIVRAVARDGRVVWRLLDVRQRMDGDDAGPLDLTSDWVTHIPVPEAAFEVNGQTILVSRVDGYEGVGFEILRLSPTIEVLSQSGIYHCAW